jgi:hypothetical protein
MRVARSLALGGALALAALALTGCAPAKSAAPGPANQLPGAVQPLAPDSLSGSLDGLSFLLDGKLYRVSGGAASEITRDGRRKLGVVSVDGSNGLLVTEQAGAGADVMYVRGAGSALRLMHVDAASTLLGVQLDAVRKRLYRAMEGDPSARLAVARLAHPSKVATISLGTSFSGEFDVCARDRGIAYTSATQKPTRLYYLRAGSVAVLTSKLAAAFTPAVSENGALVCVTGTRHAGGEIALWVLDRQTKKLRKLGSTQGLVPTHPVFSADGSWIAFRGGQDGALHAVRTDGSGLQTLPLIADDAPMAW